METRRKLAPKSLKAAAAPVAAPKRKYVAVEYASSSDDESVATQRAFEDGDDSDFDAEEEEKVGQTIRKRLPAAHAHKGNSSGVVTRQPTRRPDPNVCNRNALMARENRKRKKEQMEQLEHENGNLQRDLRKLQKVVDRQEVMIRGLRNERNYLKSVLENQSDIVTLLKRLQPQQEQTQKPQIRKESPQPVKESGASPSSIYSDSGMSLEGGFSPFYNRSSSDYNNNNHQVGDDEAAPLDSPTSIFSEDHGTEEFDLFNETLLLNDDFPLISTDLMFSADPFVVSGGEGGSDGGFDLPQDDEEEVLVKQEKSSRNGNLRRETIRSEHNYVYSNVSLIPHDNNAAVVVVKNPAAAPAYDEEEMEEENYMSAKRPRMDEVAQKRGPGICLHIGGGKVSIEFCAQCHSSASREWNFNRL